MLCWNGDSKRYERGNCKQCRNGLLRHVAAPKSSYRTCYTKAALLAVETMGPVASTDTLSHGQSV